MTEKTISQGVNELGDSRPKGGSEKHLNRGIQKEGGQDLIEQIF
jgi:hypothetical protein